MNQYLKSYMGATIWILPLLWALGIHVNDLARLNIVLLLLVFFILRKSVTQVLYSPKPYVEKSLQLFLWMYVVYLVVEPICSVYLGRQTDEYLVFSQVVDSIARRGSPLTSVVETGLDWRNFLWHHFSPFLYVPGFTSWLGVPAYLSAGIVHGLGIGVGLFLFYSFSKKFVPEFLALFGTVLLAANPTFRHSVFLGIHDEVYSIAFLGLGYWALINRKFYLMVVGLLIAATTKESLPLVVMGFILMVYYAIYFDRSTILSQSISRFSKPHWKFHLLLISLFFLMTVFFIGYFFVQPQLVGKNFDHFKKLGSITDFFNLDKLFGKLFFVIFIGLPCLFVPIFRRKYLYMILPLFPLVGILCVSNFDEMWKPMNYYGVVVSYILYFAAIVVVSEVKSFKTFMSSMWGASLLISIAFSFSGKKPAQSIYSLFREPIYLPSQLLAVPDDAKIVATPSAALFLFRANFIWRLVIANENPSLEFDRLVVKSTEVSLISPELMDSIQLCENGKESLWKIYCRK